MENIMADTRPRIPVTAAAWVEIVAVPVTAGTISPESQSIRVAFSTGVAPADLKQGHTIFAHSRVPFILEAGETLYAIAGSAATSVIVTY